MATYLDFLKAILALGPKIPQAIEIIEHIVADIQELIALVQGTIGPFGDTGMFVSDEELAVESQIAEFIDTEGEFGAGALEFLRTIYAFIQKHPEIASIILTILKGF